MIMVRFREWLSGHGHFAAPLLLVWFYAVVAWADPVPQREVPAVLLAAGPAFLAAYAVAAVWVFRK